MSTSNAVAAGKSYAEFRPEIWSKKLSKTFHNSGAMMECVNKNFEGEIKGAGDTVKIRKAGSITVGTYDGSDFTFEEASTTLVELLIDQQKYFAFKVDDVAKAQSDINVMNSHLKEAKKAIELVKDTFLLSKHADVTAGNTIGEEGTPIALTKDNIYDKLCDLYEVLETSNALQGGVKPWLMINPKAKKLIKKSPEFTHASKAGDDTIRKGAIGEIAGFDIMVSTNLVEVGGKYYFMAGTNEAITFASQVATVEDVRLEKNFGTGIKGLYVYGGKTECPEALAKLIATIA